MDSFLETSALIELVYKDKVSRDKVLACCTGKKITSRYVIFELSRGYLRNLRLLHNKATTCSGFNELFNYINNVRRKAHLAGTIIEAFGRFFRAGLASGDFKEQPEIGPDRLILIAFKGWLRKQIRHNWQKIQRQADLIINPTGCFPYLPAPNLDADQQYKHDLPKTCGDPSECGLKKYFETNRSDFEKIRSDLRQIPAPDPETKNRIRSLKELYRKRGPFKKTECYYSGDAIIVHECPSSAKIVSKNGMHLEPICKSLGKRSHYYK